MLFKYWLLFNIIVSFNVYTLYASDKKTCELSICIFNTQKIILIDPLSINHTQTDVLDTIDNLIFTGHFPYSYNSIMKVQADEKTYVQYSSYAKLCRYARECLQAKLKDLKKINTTNKHNHIQSEVAHKRIIEMLNLLGKVKLEQHVCPGATVSTRAFMCAEQWLSSYRLKNQQKKFNSALYT